MIMKTRSKFITLSIFLAALIVVIFLLIPFKIKENIPTLKKGINYNLLFITIDTLRADCLGCYGSEVAETPNIDQLAESGVMFKNCYASVPLTLPSFCSIFTGREPIAHGVRNNGTYVLNKNEHTLAEFFQELGYETYAAIAAFVLEAKFGLDQGFNIYDDSLDSKTVFENTNSEIPADRVYVKFKDWLEKNYENKFFSWIHFYDPHYPYSPPTKFIEKFNTQPYIGEIAYVDFYIGKIITDLKAKQLLDKTIIVLLGDHGEAFGEHKEIGHGIFCYEESLKVPLIFYNPGIFSKETIINHPVKLSDIMPTILTLFEIEIPLDLQGENLLPVITSKEKNHLSNLIYFESMYGKENENWAPLTGIIFENFKYISLPIPELYDFVKDPKERKNLFYEKDALAKKMEKKLNKYLSLHANPNNSNRRKLSLMDKNKLESLGYVSSSTSSPGKIIDPKEGIDLLYTIIDANHFIRDGNLEEAEHRLNQIVEENPGIKMTQLYDGLRALYTMKKNVPQLEKMLKKAITDFPEIDRYKVWLAKLYFDTKKTSKAKELCRKTLHQNSINTHANIILGRIYFKEGSFTEALPFYQKALKLEPFNTHIQIEYAELLYVLGKISEVEKITSNLMKSGTYDTQEGLNVKTRLGLLLLKMKMYNQVISLCLQILSHEHKIPQIYNLLGQAYFNTGDYQKALKAYENSLHKDKKNAFTLSSIGSLYLTLFRLKKEKELHSLSIDFYHRALDSNPELVFALNGLAAAYSFAGNRNKAIYYWEKSLQIDPEFTPVYFNLGITYIEMGENKKALKYLMICKEKYFSRLSTKEQKQLDTLIKEASQ